MQTQAEADITAGASVLLIDPLDSGSGAAIEANAEVEGRRGDRLRPADARRPGRPLLRELRQREVGKLIGQGEVDCIAAWKRDEAEHPDHGRRPDRQQREAVRPGLQRRAEARSSTTAPTSRSASPPAPGTRRPPQTTFQQQFTAHPNINAVVTPNDDNANAVISILQTNKIPAEDVPDHRSGRVARRACRTSWRATSAERCTSRSTSRPRPRPRWRCTCGPARRRRRRW